MGLPVRLVVHAGSREVADASARAAFARIAALDAVMSDYRPDSELTQLSASSGSWVGASRELFAVLSRAREIAGVTGGAFDPTIGPMVALWRAARQSKRLPSRAAVAEARTRVGWRLVELDPNRQAVRLTRAGMRLDLGGIAKGFILQEALDLLKSRGVSRVLLEAGGDIVVGDAPPGRAGWRVAVAGADAAFTARAAALVNAALSTSGPTSQFVEIGGVRYSHVVDPATGLGLTERRVVHVIAPDGATADAWATALGVGGPALAERLTTLAPDIHASFTNSPIPSFAHSVIHSFANSLILQSPPAPLNSSASSAKRTLKLVSDP